MTTMVTMAMTIWAQFIVKLCQVWSLQPRPGTSTLQTQPLWIPWRCKCNQIQQWHWSWEHDRGQRTWIWDQRWKSQGGWAWRAQIQGWGSNKWKVQAWRAQTWWVDMESSNMKASTHLNMRLWRSSHTSPIVSQTAQTPPLPTHWPCIHSIHPPTPSFPSPHPFPVYTILHVQINKVIWPCWDSYLTHLHSMTMNTHL